MAGRLVVINVEKSTIVHRPSDEVFAFVADQTNARPMAVGDRGDPAAHRWSDRESAPGTRSPARSWAGG